MFTIAAFGQINVLRNQYELNLYARPLIREITLNDLCIWLHPDIHDTVKRREVNDLHALQAIRRIAYEDADQDTRITQDASQSQRTVPHMVTEHGLVDIKLKRRTT